MALEVEFNHPDFPKGTEFEVEGVLMHNGEKRELTEDEEVRFVRNAGSTVRDAVGKNPHISVSGNATVTPSKVSTLFPDERSTVPATTVASSEGTFVEKSNLDQGGES